MASLPADLMRSKIMNMVYSANVAKAICIACTLEIADIVTPTGSVSVGELANVLKCHKTNLHRLMSLLAAYGIFEQVDGQKFIGNELSECLRERNPQSCYHLIQIAADKEVWQSLVNLELVLQKDYEKPCFELVTGKPYFKYLSSNPEKQKHYDLGVLGDVGGYESIPEIYDFSQYKVICDIGGGPGLLLHAILKKCSSVNAILFEIPAVLENILPDLNQNDRFKTITGNLLEKIDVSADLFMCCFVLHMFRDSQLEIMVRNIVEAMRQTKGARLLQIEINYEQLMKPNEMTYARTLDIGIMSKIGGIERSTAMWQDFFKVRGLQLIRKLEFPPKSVALEWELA